MAFLFIGLSEKIKSLIFLTLLLSKSIYEAGFGDKSILNVCVVKLNNIEHNNIYPESGEIDLKIACFFMKKNQISDSYHFS
ncbi:hypothetical protein [Lysinibacillus parviboronicapiens]|uniref:hypothetical protein n=1 Tax=Lysinibacillus parviboronicapiens TaxID=436516 RepID=UPI000D3A5A71|nr:hypothetical protein [Lysinibacillus parviboronicapiens]